MQSRDGIYFYNVRIDFSRVSFENRVIDIFDEQIRNLRLAPTAEQLIDNYYEVCRILGKRPVADDLSGPNKPGKYSLTNYKSLFGSWNNFLTSIGEIPIIKPPTHGEQSFKQNWLDLKTKLGRVPTTKDL